MSPDLETLQLEGYTLFLMLQEAHILEENLILCKLQVPASFILKEITELVLNVLDFTVIMLTDEEGETRIEICSPYFLRARSKICYIQVKIQHILCFVGKELSEVVWI